MDAKSPVVFLLAFSALQMLGMDAGAAVDSPRSKSSLRSRAASAGPFGPFRHLSADDLSSERVAALRRTGSSTRGAKNHVAGAGAAFPGAPSRGAGHASVSSVPDGAGGQYSVFSDFRDGHSDVYVMRVTNSGAPAGGWPADGVPLCTAPGDQLPVLLIGDNANGVIVLWFDGRDDWQAFSIYAQRVNAAGTPQWTANGVALAGAGVFYDVVAAPDGSGGVVAAWSSGALGTDINAIRITGAGAVAAGWDPGGEVVCDDPAEQYNVAVASDGSGGAVIAWEDYRSLGGESHVFAQRIDASGAAQWTANGIQVDASAFGVLSPALSPAASGHVLVFWAENSAGPARGQRLDGAGNAQWTAGGVEIHPSGNFTDSEVGAVSDGAGGAVVYWYAYDVGVEGYKAQRVDGTGALQWPAGGAVLVSHDDAFPSDLDVVPDGSGGAYFAWTDSRNDIDSDVYAQRVASNGTLAWTANGLAVATTAGHQVQPLVALDGAGGALVSWLDSRSLDGEIYTQRFNAAGAAQFAANGIATYANPGVQFGPLTLQTSDGGVLAVWNEKRNGQYDIRARKFDAAGNPVGAATTICDAPEHQTALGLIDDGAGGAIVSWLHHVNDQNDFYAQRIDGNANPVWAHNGVAICTDPGFQGAARMITDGAGGAILAWYDGRDPSNPDIYAQRVTSAGVADWTANGIAVCNDPGVQDNPVLAPDGAGGAIIAWPDRRLTLPQVYAQRVDSDGDAQWAVNGELIADYSPAFVGVRLVAAIPGAPNQAIFLIHEASFDIMTFEPKTILHAQRVDGSGAEQWGTQGSTVCDATSSTVLEQMIPDGSGGAYAAWADDRNGPFDLFAQHIDATTGSPTWNANGNAVCDASGWQHAGAMTRAAGDVIFTWADQRLGHPDVYAQRLDATGAEVWADNGVVVSDATRGQFAAGVAPWKTATPERLFVGWTDNRAADQRLVYMMRLDLNGVGQWTEDGITGTKVALVSAEATGDRVRLVWFGSETLGATVYRRIEGGEWTAVGTVSSDGTDKLVFEDRAITAGVRYGYRLGIPEAGGEVFTGEAWVTVPSHLRLALNGVRPNPAVRELAISFTLPSADVAKLEFIDLAGRRVRTQDLVGFAPGRHTVHLNDVLPPSGVYFLRLSQNGRSVSTRVSVMN
jgi:hypothetical protein